MEKKSSDAFKIITEKRTLGKSTHRREDIIRTNPRSMFPSEEFD